MRKNMFISGKKFIAFIVCFVTVLTLVGCSSKSSIVGTWTTVDGGYEITMKLYEDGTCIDVPYEIVDPGVNIQSYKLQEDGMIIFTELDGTITVEPTDNEETALEDSDYYYLSENKLIMNKRTFEMQ